MGTTQKPHINSTQLREALEAYKAKKLNEKMNTVKVETFNDLIISLPNLPQVQYDLTQQLTELYHIANKFGLYDAADFIRYRNGKDLFE